jgi:hypothetical protein
VARCGSAATCAAVGNPCVIGSAWEPIAVRGGWLQVAAGVHSVGTLRTIITEVDGRTDSYLTFGSALVISLRTLSNRVRSSSLSPFKHTS